MKLHIHKTSLSKKQIEKVNSDLKFLKKLLSVSKKNELRVVVSGGYGLDGILGEITRSHNDLDLVIFGNINRKKAVKIFRKFILSIYPGVRIKIEPSLYNIAIDMNIRGFGGTIYFVETINNPFRDINTIKLANGQAQVNSEKRFPIPVKAKLGSLKFEAQNPNFHLADILYKRKQKILTKHSQDIKNLQQITKKTKVGYILSEY